MKFEKFILRLVPFTEITQDVEFHHLPEIFTLYKLTKLYVERCSIVMNSRLNGIRGLSILDFHSFCININDYIDIHTMDTTDEEMHAIYSM